MKNLILIIVVVMLLTGCADVSPQMLSCAPSDPYGFWGGLWHGIVAPISFFGSIFSDDIALYAMNNTGGWYDFGFILGIGGLSSSVKLSK